MRDALSEQQFHKALDSIWHIVSEANKYVDEQAPWTLRKTDQARMATVLYVLADVIRRLAIVIQPFMPHSMGKLLDQLAFRRGSCRELNRLLHRRRRTAPVQPSSQEEGIGRSSHRKSSNFPPGPRGMSGK